MVGSWTYAYIYINMTDRQLSTYQKDYEMYSPNSKTNAGGYIYFITSFYTFFLFLVLGILN